MISRVKSVTLRGLNCEDIQIEVDISKGIHSFQIVGLPDSVISESRERIKVAIKSSGFDFPRGKVVVNLSPSDLKKEGSAFDLPIALAILNIGEKMKTDLLEDILILGELSLDGSLGRINGALSIVEHAKSKGYKKVILPASNISEVSIMEHVSVFGFDNLKEVFQFLNGRNVNLVKSEPVVLNDLNEVDYSYDFSCIKGQEKAKRALKIAAAGGHNILLTGTPGSGKTMLLRAFKSILPPMSREEILEVSKIYSISGLLTKEKPLITSRPFRIVHNSASLSSIIGGGRNARPGEISLANKGAIFLDEFSEFPNSVLEALRQPMEDKEVTVTRVYGSYTYPADFILVAAMNPCRCGFNGHDNSKCKCSPFEILKYQKKISGPIVDRIDLFVKVDPVKTQELDITFIDRSLTDEIRKNVIRAREIQTNRFKDHLISTNSVMNLEHITKYCQLNMELKKLLDTAVDKLNISARGFFRIIKVARTIADLEGQEEITSESILEALQYRSNY